MIDKAGHLEDLAPGDRIVWSDGPYEVRGTVTDVTLHTVQGVNGPVVNRVTAVIDVPDFPTWDSWGWPASEPRTVTRDFYRADPIVGRAYTPDPPDPSGTI